MAWVYSMRLPDCWLIPGAMLASWIFALSSIFTQSQQSVAVLDLGSSDISCYEIASLTGKLGSGDDDNQAAYLSVEMGNNPCS